MKKRKTLVYNLITILKERGGKMRGQLTEQSQQCWNEWSISDISLSSDFLKTSCEALLCAGL